MQVQQVNIRRLLARLQSRISALSSGSACEEERAAITSLIGLANSMVDEINDVDFAGTHRRQLAFMSEALTSGTSSNRQPPQPSPPSAQREQSPLDDEATLRLALLGGEDKLVRRRSSAPESSLDADQVQRGMLADDILHHLNELKENSLSVQRALAEDDMRLRGVEHIMEQNLEQVDKGNRLVKSSIQSYSAGCRLYCSVVSFVFIVFFGTLLFMRFIPSPSRR